jgi:hypothetical protein
MKKRLHEHENEYVATVILFLSQCIIHVGEIDSLWKGKVFATDRPLNGAGYLVSVQVFSSEAESNRKYRV